jgi:hypothetical protein
MAQRESGSSGLRRYLLTRLALAPLFLFVLSPKKNFQRLFDAKNVGRSFNEIGRNRARRQTRALISIKRAGLQAQRPRRRITFSMKNTSLRANPTDLDRDCQEWLM